MSWVQWLLGCKKPDKEQESRQNGLSTSDQPPTSSDTIEKQEQAKVYIEKVRDKIEKLAQDFAAGTINRDQFQKLYSHYQREIQQVESLLVSDPQSWESAVTEGQSVLIRRKHLARAKAYALYDNQTGLPIGVLGNFDFDPALLVPMLSSYRSATKEIFGGGMRFSQIEGGQWVCFVPGEFTTLLALFTNEPAAKQLEYLDELHRLFEQANRPHLMQKSIDTSRLLYPHEYFLGKWRS
ncbi:MAG: hypothetical protein AB1345_10495 [Chloroflexota bacterium]